MRRLAEQLYFQIHGVAVLEHCIEDVSHELKQLLCLLCAYPSGLLALPRCTKRNRAMIRKSHFAPDHARWAACDEYLDTVVEFAVLAREEIS